jgi:hypothetical protein
MHESRQGQRHTCQCPWLRLTCGGGTPSHGRDGKAYALGQGKGEGRTLSYLLSQSHGACGCYDSIVRRFSSAYVHVHARTVHVMHMNEHVCSKGTVHEEPCQ